jgi:hypothetical protein
MHRETRRHNDYGVDISGHPLTVDGAMAALSGYPRLLELLTAAQALLNAKDNQMETRAEWDGLRRAIRAAKRQEQAPHRVDAAESLKRRKQMYCTTEIRMYCDGSTEEALPKFQAMLPDLIAMLQERHPAITADADEPLTEDDLTEGLDSESDLEDGGQDGKE